MTGSVNLVILFVTSENFPIPFINCFFYPTCDVGCGGGVTNSASHFVGGVPSGVVLSEHQDEGLVRDGHGDLLQVVILRPSLVVLADRLAGRVSVRTLLRLGQ